MTGDLLTASFNKSIYRIKLNAAGNAVESSTVLFSSVGGGTVIVPLLILWLGYGEREATGTSLAAIVPIAAAGAAVYAADISVDFGLGALLALGSIFGAPLGARLLAGSSDSALKIAEQIAILPIPRPSQLVKDIPPELEAFSL